MHRAVPAVAALALLLAGALGAGEAAGADAVTLQLKWRPQAQFAGYYAARARGFYAAERLEVTLRPGGPDLVAETEVAEGRAQFGIAWLPGLLAARDRGAPLVNIAQVFSASGMRLIAFKDSGIRRVADLRGRRVGVWFGGNEYPLLALLDRHGLDPRRDLTLVPQPFDMEPFLRRQVDAAAAMTYNEYRMVLEAGVRPEDLVVIDFNAEGTALPEDGIVVHAGWLAAGGHRDIAARFLRASLQGWRHCRAEPADCVNVVMAEGPAQGRAHQSWMLQEVNRLIWGPPAPAGPLGRMDPAAFRRAADLALRFGIIRRPAGPEAYTDAVWEAAQAPR